MNRRIVLVLGMHRSGTSAMAGVLNLLGAEMPGELLPAAEDNNQKGFFETKELYHFHEAVLAEAGSSWESPIPVQSSYFESGQGQRRRAELADMLRREYAPHHLTAVKDPRMCRLLPLWMPALNDALIQPVAVLPLRHPLEVARSLESRNEFGLSKGLLLWLQHVLAAERGTREIPRVFVHYDELLTDWRAVVDRIDRVLDLDFAGSAVPERVAEFLGPELRHYTAEDGPEAMPDAPDGLAEAWQAMGDLVASPDDQRAMTTLDEIARRYEQASRVFGPFVRWAQTTLIKMQDPRHVLQEGRRLERELAAARAELAGLEQTRRERDEAQAELAAVSGTTAWRLSKALRQVTKGLRPMQKRA